MTTNCAYLRCVRRVCTRIHAYLKNMTHPCVWHFVWHVRVWHCPCMCVTVTNPHVWHGSLLWMCVEKVRETLVCVCACARAPLIVYWISYTFSSMQRTNNHVSVSFSFVSFCLLALTRFPPPPLPCSCVLLLSITVSLPFPLFLSLSRSAFLRRGGGLGSRPKKMYGERLGDGVEYHLMSPTPRRSVPFTTGRRAH